VIEQGLRLLIQAGITSLSLNPAGNGAAVQLPENLISSVTPMAWTYRCIISEPTYILEGQDGFTDLEVQIDCHGYAMVNAIALARAIDGVLRGGYSGTLSDPDSTFVFGIIRIGPFIDGFSDANRSYVRTLEYSVQYGQI